MDVAAFYNRRLVGTLLGQFLQGREREVVVENRLPCNMHKEPHEVINADTVMPCVI